MIPRGNLFRWIFAQSPWTLWVYPCRRCCAWIVATWHAVLADEALSALQFPAHFGQRPDLFGTTWQPAGRTVDAQTFVQHDTFLGGQQQ